MCISFGVDSILRSDRRVVSLGAAEPALTSVSAVEEEVSCNSSNPLCCTESPEHITSFAVSSQTFTPFPVQQANYSWKSFNPVLNLTLVNGSQLITAPELLTVTQLEVRPYEASLSANSVAQVSSFIESPDDNYDWSGVNPTSSGNTEGAAFDLMLGNAGDEGFLVDKSFIDMGGASANKIGMTSQTWETCFAENPCQPTQACTEIYPYGSASQASYNTESSQFYFWLTQLWNWWSDGSPDGWWPVLLQYQNGFEAPNNVAANAQLYNATQSQLCYGPDSAACTNNYLSTCQFLYNVRSDGQPAQSGDAITAVAAQVLNCSYNPFLPQAFSVNISVAAAAAGLARGGTPLPGALDVYTYPSALTIKNIGAMVGFFAADVSACCVTNPNIPSTTCGPQTFTKAPSPIALGPGEIGAFDYGLSLAAFPNYAQQPIPLSCYCNFTVAVMDNPASNISIPFQPVVSWYTLTNYTFNYNYSSLFSTTSLYGQPSSAGLPAANQTAANNFINGLIQFNLALFNTTTAAPTLWPGSILTSVATWSPYGYPLSQVRANQALMAQSFPSLISAERPAMAEFNPVSSLAISATPYSPPSAPPPPAPPPPPPPPAPTTASPITPPSTTMGTLTPTATPTQGLSGPPAPPPPVLASLQPPPPPSPSPQAASSAPAGQPSAEYSMTSTPLDPGYGTIYSCSVGSPQCGQHGALNISCVCECDSGWVSLASATGNGPYCNISAAASTSSSKHTLWFGGDQGVGPAGAAIIAVASLTAISAIILAHWHIQRKHKLKGRSLQHVLSAQKTEVRPMVHSASNLLSSQPSGHLAHQPSGSLTHQGSGALAHHPSGSRQSIPNGPAQPRSAMGNSPLTMDSRLASTMGPMKS